jgi:hypothetical protein
MHIFMSVAILPSDEIVYTNEEEGNLATGIAAHLIAN